MSRIHQVLKAVTRVAHARLYDTTGWQRTLLEECQNLGGVYVKFLQMIAIHLGTRGFSEINNRTVFEQVQYEPIDVIQQLTDSLGTTAQDIFLDMADEPFAAGSYGQVYLAHLKENNQSVIVKVLRPSVRRYLRTDLRILGVAARIVGWFTSSSMVNTRLIFKEFSRSTLLETDYIHEAEAGETLREYFSYTEKVYIPRTYINLSKGSVLVQDYVGGLSLASAIDQQKEGYDIEQLVHRATGSDVWQQLQTLGSEMLRATLKADYLMVDPHPGNVRLLDNNRVALIDFGLVAPAPTNRDAFAAVIREYLNLYQGNFDAGAFAMASLSFYDPELYDALVAVARSEQKDYRGYLRTFVATRIAEDEDAQRCVQGRYMTYLFNDFINDGNNLGLHLAEENALVQKSMAMFIITTRQIGERHGSDIYFGIMERALVAAYEEAAHTPTAMRRATMTEEHAYEVMSSWLEAVAERNQTLYRQVVQGGVL